MRNITVCLVTLALFGCSSNAWKTTGEVLDILAGPTPKEECEQKGGKWEEYRAYDPQTGKLLKEVARCTKEMK